MTTDGVAVKANSLAVNGSTITDLLGNNLDLKHNAVANAGDSQIVGTTVSGIGSLAFTSTGPYKINDTITITVQTTEKVTVTGTPRIPMIFGTNTKVRQLCQWIWDNSTFLPIHRRCGRRRYGWHRNRRKRTRK